MIECPEPCCFSPAALSAILIDWNCPCIPLIYPCHSLCIKHWSKWGSPVHISYALNIVPHTMLLCHAYSLEWRRSYARATHISACLCWLAWHSTICIVCVAELTVSCEYEYVYASVVHQQGALCASRSGLQRVKRVKLSSCLYLPVFNVIFCLNRIS